MAGLLLTYFFGDRLAQLRSPGCGGSVRRSDVVVLAVGLLVALITGIALRGWKRNRRRALGLLAIGGAGGIHLGLVISVPDNAVVRCCGRHAHAMLALILIAFGESMLLMRAGFRPRWLGPVLGAGKGLPERLIRESRHNAVLPNPSRLFTAFYHQWLVIIKPHRNVCARQPLLLCDRVGRVPVIIGIIAVVGVIGLVLRIALDIVRRLSTPDHPSGGSRHDSAMRGYEIGGWADTRRLRNKMAVVSSTSSACCDLAFIHPILQATVWSDNPAVYRPMRVTIRQSTIHQALP
jgi:hypothetical protein